MGEVRISEKDHDVRLAVGDDLVIELPENATTGYRWQRVAVGGGLEVHGDDFVAPDLSLAGAAGTRVIRVRAREAGEHGLELELKRPWGGEAAGRHTVTVHVE